MQPVLPSSLDMTSANVLGFDAQAYINDTPSTLHKRLNIPGSFAAGDYFASSTAVAPKRKKSSKLAAIFAGIVSTAGLGALAFGLIKGKIKPSKFASSVKSTVPNFFKNLKDNISQFSIKSTVKPVKIFFGNIANRIKGLKK